MLLSLAMKKYQSHKIVEAGKVLAVDRVAIHDKLGWQIDLGYPGKTYWVNVSRELAHRGGNDPVGGYYVKYPDGFESWSPAEAFEKGYTEVKMCPVCGSSPIIPTIYPTYACTRCANEGRVSE